MPNGPRSAIRSACSGWRAAACSCSTDRRRPFHHPRHAAASAARRASRARVAARMIRIALTGSIGMGKSTVAEDVRARRHSGVRCRRGGAPAAGARRRTGRARSASCFPGACRCGTLDRECLAADRARRPRRSSPRSSGSFIPPCAKRAKTFVDAHRDAQALVFEIPLAVRNRRREGIRQGRRRLRAGRRSARAGACSGRE